MTTNIIPPAPAGTPAPGTPAPSSGQAPPKVEGQQASSKEQPQPAKTAAEAGQPKADNAGVKPQGAPETYTFRPSAEGLELGVEVQGALSEVGKTLNLTNDAVQQLVDKAAPALAAQSKRQIAAMVQGWIDESKSDPEIGGEQLDKTLALSKRVLDLGPPELRKLLGPVSEGGTGLGNHRAILLWTAKLAKALSPDTFVSGTGSGEPPQKSLAARIYGTPEKA